MATPPASPHPPPPPAGASMSQYTLKRTRKATRLRSLATRPPGAERLVVNVDPANGKANGPHKKKLRIYLGIVARDKVDVTYETWKEVPVAQKDLIREDIQAEFEILEASDSRKKKKIFETVSEWWRQFKSDLTKKWALAADKDGVDDTICEKYDISKEKWAQFCQTRRDPSWEGLALPPEPEVGPLGARVSIKESCVDPSGNDLETGDSGLISLGRLYEGSTTVHNIPLFHGQVKVGVKEVKDAEAPIPVPIDETIVSPAKPPESLDHEVDDPLYLMTLTIPQLFLKPFQVMWDAIVFGVFNQNFLLYIKHEDLSEIAHGGQCFSIFVIQLWILPDNYLKGIINSALKGLDDTPQPKSKAAARWIVVKYFNDVRPLEVERFKALRIQWAQYYLKVRNQT
ncbi:hypothetical protein GmHk_04G011079 [Glycine max]|nr:hypothetical protein GmHk_04G011079 [Glycine max]